MFFHSMGKETLINIKGPSFHFRDVSANKDGYREAQYATSIVNGRGCTVQCRMKIKRNVRSTKVIQVGLLISVLRTNIE